MQFFEGPNSGSHRHYHIYVNFEEEVAKMISGRNEPEQ